MDNYPSTERRVAGDRRDNARRARRDSGRGRGNDGARNRREVAKSPPEVRDAAADLEAGGVGGDQLVRVYHQASDNIDVDEMEILMTLPNGNTERLQNMPLIVHRPTGEIMSLMTVTAW